MLGFCWHNNISSQRGIAKTYDCFHLVWNNRATWDDSLGYLFLPLALMKKTERPSAVKIFLILVLESCFFMFASSIVNCEAFLCIGLGVCAIDYIFDLKCLQSL